jgi:UDP-N-acetylmuramoyl-tripeptide--D-alanyl-D-alanine ligase
VENTRTVSYGVAADSTADYRGSDLSVGISGSTFTVTAPDGERCTYTTRLLGSHNIQNLVGCIAIAHQMGIPLSKLVYPVRLLKPVEHRLELLPNGFIDDAYNANPVGFKAALDVLAAFPGQRVLVTPGMVELGTEQEKQNEECGAYAADKCDYAVLVGVKQAPPLQKGLLSAGFPPERLFVAKTLQEGLAWVAGLPAEGPRTVLLENDLPDNFM